MINWINKEKALRRVLVHSKWSINLGYYFDEVDEDEMENQDIFRMRSKILDRLI